MEARNREADAMNAFDAENKWGQMLAATARTAMESSPARGSAVQTRSTPAKSPPSVELLKGRTFAVRRSNGEVEHGWKLSQFADTFGELKSGEVMCVSPDEGTFRACGLQELFELNKISENPESGAWDASTNSFVSSAARIVGGQPPPPPLKPDTLRGNFRRVDDEPPPLPTQPPNASLPNRGVRPAAPPPQYGAASLQTQKQVASSHRTPGIKFQSPSAVQSTAMGFEHYLNLTPNDQNASPPDARNAVLGAPPQPALEAELAELLLKYNDLSRRHAATQRELEELKSSPSAVSTSVVLSDMYGTCPSRIEKM